MDLKIPIYFPAQISVSKRLAVKAGSDQVVQEVFAR